MNALINIGIQAARKAGEVSVRYMDRVDRLHVERKGRNDFVSEVDRLAEQEIVEFIHKRYPGHSILAEESGETPAASRQKPGDKATRWIIDPLDGTTNYLHGHPNFAVSIAVEIEGVIEHGIIFDPLRNDMFVASRNQGARLNDRRIHTSRNMDMRSSLVTSGIPGRELAAFGTWLKCANAVVKKVGSIRHSGSAALDLAYVACGRTDAFWEPCLKPWDVAAGSLLVREAKGIVCDLSGGEGFMNSGNILAANPSVFPGLLALLVKSGSKNL